MRCRLVPILTIAVAAALLAPSVASATTIAYEARGSVRKVSQTGTTVVYRGHVRSPTLGRARVAQRLRLEGLSASGTFRVRYRGGTIRGRVHATARIEGGAAVFKGRLRITGGTGRFTGARGRGRYSGRSTLDLSRATFHQRGRVVY